MWTQAEFDIVIEGISSLGWSVLKSFSTQYTSSEVLAAFAALSREEFSHLRSLHFLRLDVTGAFLAVHVPKFLQAVPLASHSTIEESRRPPRGRIDWPKTISSRNRQGGDKTVFVTTPPQKTTDSQPARMVAFLLSQLVEMSDRVLGASVPETARQDIEARRRLAQRSLAALMSRGVTCPAKFGERELDRLRKTRRRDLLAAVDLFDLWKQIVGGANEGLIAEVLGQALVAPGNHDDLFEVWALLTLVHRYLDAGWSITQARLVGGLHAAKLPRFVLEADGRTIEIYYQTIPDEMVKISRYKAIFQDYDLRSAVRRPDLTVVSSDFGNINRYIVEVKRTKDPTYIADSVYKTLGYLNDFGAALTSNKPSAVLLVWSGIVRTDTDSKHEVEIVTAAEFATMPLLL